MVSAVSIITAMSMLVGCGGGDSSGAGGSNKPGSSDGNWEYVATYNDFLKIEGNTYVMSFTSTDEKFYYGKYDYDPETWEGDASLWIKDIETGDEKQVEIDMPFEGSDLYISDMATDSDGNLALIADFYNEETDEEIFCIQSYSADGEFLSSVNLSDIIEVDAPSASEEDGYYYFNYFFPSQLCIDKNGNYVFCDGNETIYCVNSETYELEYEATADGYIFSMVNSGDEIYVSGYMDIKSDSMVVMKWDTDKQDFYDETYEHIPSDAYYMFAGNDGMLYFNSGNNLYRYDLELQESEKILNWIACDIDGTSVSEISVAADGSITAYLEEWGQDDTYKVYQVDLVWTEITEENRKDVITLAVYYLDWDLRDQILQFNRHNTEYRIEVVDYSNYEDWDEAIEQMMDDFTGDGGIDIIEISQLNARSLAAQGYLLDMQPYFDANLNKDDYFENVIDAGKVGDALYVVSPYFSVLTAATKSELVDGKTDWTPSEFCEYVSNAQKETGDSGFYSRDEVLSLFCMYNADAFVDWNTGECNFNSQEFIDILNLCAAFPEEIDWSVYENANYPELISSGAIPVFYTSFYEVYEIQEYELMADGELIFIGFPCGDECAPVAIGSNSSFAISSTTDYADGAWEFIEYLINEENQSMVSYNFPINKSALDNILEEAATPEYQKDENGNMVEAPKYTYGYDDLIMEIYAASEEDIAAVYELIGAARGNLFIDEEIYNIISEEAQAFFNGQKSAEEVAEIIQSRVKVYVAELL